MLSPGVAADGGVLSGSDLQRPVLQRKPTATLVQPHTPSVLQEPAVLTAAACGTQTHSYPPLHVCVLQQRSEKRWYLDDRCPEDTGRDPTGQRSCGDTDWHRSPHRPAPCPHNAHLDQLQTNAGAHWISSELHVTVTDYTAVIFI